MYGCFSSMSVCTTCMLGAQGGQKKALDPLGLDLKMLVSCLMGAGN